MSGSFKLVLSLVFLPVAYAACSPEDMPTCSQDLLTNDAIMDLISERIGADVRKIKVHITIKMDGCDYLVGLMDAEGAFGRDAIFRINRSSEIVSEFGGL